MFGVRFTIIVNKISYELPRTLKITILNPQKIPTQERPLKMLPPQRDAIEGPLHDFVNAEANIYSATSSIIIGEGIRILYFFRRAS